MNSYKSSTVSSLTGGVASHLSSSSSPPCGNDGQMPFGCHEDDQDHVCQQVGIVTDRTRSFPTLRKAFTRTAATTLFQPWCLSETALLGGIVSFSGRTKQQSTCGTRSRTGKAFSKPTWDRRSGMLSKPSGLQRWVRPPQGSETSLDGGLGLRTRPGARKDWIVITAGLINLSTTGEESVTVSS